MNTGEGLQRMEWSLYTTPLVEQTLSTALPMIKRFEWTWDNEDTRALDEFRGIDLICRLKTNQPLTVQVKVLNQTQFHTVTIETKNRHNDSEGDWQNDLSQYLLCIYSETGDDILRWALIDQGRLRLATVTKNLLWQKNANSKSNAGSSFKFLPFAELAEQAPEAIVYFGGNWELGDADIEGRRIYNV